MKRNSNADAKAILMLQGNGLNEAAWAKLSSRHRTTILIQQGVFEHVEIWHQGQLTMCGPFHLIKRRQALDNYLFGTLLFLRIAYLWWRHARKHQVDLVISTSHSSGLFGYLLQKIGIAKRNVLLLCDHFPVRGNFAIRFHRRSTGYLRQWLAGRFAEVWRVSTRIPAIGRYTCEGILPIWIDENTLPAEPRSAVGYVGVPSPDHGLDLLFEICRRHNLPLRVLGDSAYLRTIKASAPPDTRFYGTVDEATKEQALNGCFCGYAVYRTTGAESYSYYGVPSKCFAYFGCSLPVITTNTSEFCGRIEEDHLGRVVQPRVEEIEAAILLLRKDYAVYADSVEKFRKQWNAGVSDFLDQRLQRLG